MISDQKALVPIHDGETVLVMPFPKAMSSGTWAEETDAPESFGLSNTFDAVAPTPTLSFDNNVVIDPEQSMDAVFTVSISPAPATGETVTVYYDTERVAGTATPVDDYTPTSGSLVFSDTVTEHTISVPVIGDDVDDAFDVEDFYVELYNVTGDAVIGDGLGKGEIHDDDPLPTMTIDDLPDIPENDGGSHYEEFTVSLSAASEKTISVEYGTSDGTTTAGADYTATSGTLTFDPGQTSLPVSVEILDDT